MIDKRLALEDLIAGAAKDLWTILDGVSEGPHLMFPDTREATQRLGSEQEARFLLCRRLESSDFYYSVESPSYHLYKKAVRVSRQEEEGIGTAHIDVFVYYKHGTEFRLANIELKSGVPDRPTATWDILKLIREPKDGVWIVVLPHDLTTARFACFLVDVKNALEEIADTFQLLNGDRLTFVLLFMHRRIVSIVSIDGCETWLKDTKKLLDPSLFEDSVQPKKPWRSLVSETNSGELLFEGPLRIETCGTGRTLPAERVSFVYAPTIEPNTWLVMSTDTQAGRTRYALRHFGLGNRSKASLKPEQASGIESFREKYVRQEMAAGETGERLPPLKEIDYWRSRLEVLNRDI